MTARIMTQTQYAEMTANMKQGPSKLTGPAGMMECAEAAAILGVSANTIRSGIKRGNIPGIIVARRFLVPREQFEIWYERSVNQGLVPAESKPAENNATSTQDVAADVAAIVKAAHHEQLKIQRSVIDRELRLIELTAELADSGIVRIG